MPEKWTKQRSVQAVLDLLKALYRRLYRKYVALYLSVWLKDSRSIC